MRFGHIHDGTTELCSCANGSQLPVWDAVNEAAPTFDKPYQEDDESREPVLAVDSLDCGCGTVIDHLAEPGDLHCQRCGAELSVEDGAKINEKYFVGDENFENASSHPLTESDAARYFDQTVEEGSLSRAQRYAEMMQRGEWKHRGDLITFRAGERLIDGIMEGAAQNTRIAADVADLFQVPRETVGLSPDDIEPDTYQIVKLPEDWWALRHLRSGTDIVKIHGPGAQQDITQRWNEKTTPWLEWKERHDS